jgi:hypothetical protein
MPFDMDLIVKEHYGMLGKRPQGFYEKIKSMPKVILVSPLEDQFKLIKQSEFVCTITGTAGWEALMLKKPALILGEHFPFLPLKEGFVHETELTKLEEAIKKVLTIVPATDETILNFIASVFKKSFSFPTEFYWGKINQKAINEQYEIIKNICDQILKK